MAQSAFYKTVIDRPAAAVWDVVRDFNDYPAWIESVTDSHIEGGLSGTAVGAVRNFGSAAGRTRQRLAAHSDIERYFTYESCGPMSLDDEGTTRTIGRYRGTLRLREILEGDRCPAEWSAEYECDSADSEFSTRWWAGMLPSWLESLKSAVSGSDVRRDGPRTRR